MRIEIKIGLAAAIMGFFAQFVFGGGADKKADIPALVKAGALVVDVRTPGEFAGGHIKDSVNIPYDSITRQIGMVAPDKDRAVILYCQSGGRAAAAKKALIRAGYTNVVNAGTLRAMRKHHL